MQQLEEMIKKKFSEMFGQPKIPVEGLNNEKRLAGIFRAFEEDLKFYEEFITALNEQNAQLKVREIENKEQIDQLNKALSQSRRKSTYHNKLNSAHNFSENIQTRKQLDQLVKDAVKQNKYLRQQLEQAKQKQKQLHQKVRALQENLEIQKNNTKHLSSNEQLAKNKQIQLKGEITKLTQNWKKDKEEYQRSFFEQYSKKVSDIQSKTQKQLILQKQKANKKIEQQNKIIRKIITTVESIWSVSGDITYSLKDQFEESDIQQWIKKFNQIEKKFQQQIEKVLRPSLKIGKSRIVQFAELQKEKITAKRYYLLKNVMN